MLTIKVAQLNTFYVISKQAKDELQSSSFTNKERLFFHIVKPAVASLLGW